MRKKRNQKGFTIAEMMIVVGIITVLAGVAFTGVTRYMRSMTKLQYDGYARELFVAAQNHLTMAQSQGYLGRTDFGTEEDGDAGIYYFVVSGAHAQLYQQDSVLSLMLPVASVDEALRFGMSYVIRYHRELGQVMDVFCWSETVGRYPYRQAADYAGFLKNKDNRNIMMRYGEEKSVIGYYGGAAALSLARGGELSAPTISVVNAETLYVVVKNPNQDIEGARLKLIVTGETSGKVWESELTEPDVNGQHTVVLDDITNELLRFTVRTGAAQLIPGENIRIRAVAFNNTALSNVAYSAESVTNSLFADGSSEDTAKLAYFRHLENLDANRSDVPYQNIEGVAITRAEQLNDLLWSEDCFADAYDPNYAYRPVNIDKDGNQLEYDGLGHSIDTLAVSGEGNAGVFGTFQGVSISNLKLIDLSVSGTNAGALAGLAEGAAITNVLAFNSDSRADATVVGSGSVGGLVGTASGCQVERSAAALVVRSSDVAGGLIGTADEGTQIIACYSGGHTVNGAYSSDAYNVTGVTAAGGLVGSLAGGSLAGGSLAGGARQSYSTCSVQGGCAGGFVGEGVGSFSDCYATGLVSGEPEQEGAFAGTLSGTAENCLYFSIINERDVEGGTDGSKGFTYLAAVGEGEGDGSGVSALDADAATYNGFVGASGTWAKAVTYDDALSLYYKNFYNLKTVSRLGATVENTDFVVEHYGDWPVPETFAVNVPSAE